MQQLTVALFVVLDLVLSTDMNCRDSYHQDSQRIFHAGTVSNPSHFLLEKIVKCCSEKRRGHLGVFRATVDKIHTSCGHVRLRGT